MTLRIKLIVIITIIGALFRFWDLGQNPQSLNWDEIAIGYNAYSILQTGRDEFGNQFPTTFRSFEDYKSPVYIYLTVPAVFIFGKTEFAIRWTSALLGTLTIPVVVHLTVQLLRRSSIQPMHTNIGIIAGFLLAILPWHVHFSRVAFEANSALFFVCVGTWLVLKWLTEHSLRYALLSASFFALAIHSYANMRLFVPLLLFGLLLPYARRIFNYWQQFLIMCIVGVVFTLPLLVQLYQGIGFARYDATSIINRPEIYELINQRFTQEVIEQRTFFARVIYNPRWAIAGAFLESYLSHFTYEFLFAQKEATRFTIPGVGLLYFWMLPLLLIGTVYVIHKRERCSKWAVFWWLIVAPVASGLTWDTPHAIRTEVMIIPLVILCAIGLWSVLKFLQHSDIKHYRSTHSPIRPILWVLPKLSFLFVVFVISASIVRMLHNYHHHLPVERAEVWLYGRKEMVAEVQQIQHEFQEVYVAQSLEWAYLWFLWYSDIDPEEYLAQGGTKSGAFDFAGNEIGNIKFKNFNYTEDSLNKSGILFVGQPSDFPPEFVPGKVIENKAGQKFIYLIRS